MKKYKIILIIIFCFNQKLEAYCGSSSFIHLVTSDSIVPKNSIFLVESTNDLLILRNLKKVYNAYLKSKNDSIKLEVIKYNQSGSGLSQVLLKPKRFLNANEEYRLFIDWFSVKILLNEDKTIFKVQNNIDNEPPKIEKYTEFLYKYSLNYGCGAEAYAKFGVCLKDVNPTFAITKLKNIETDYVQEYILPISNHTISIGRDMCGGEFYLGENIEYEVSFTYMDLAGNKTIDSNKYYFTAPNESDDINSIEKKIFNGKIKSDDFSINIGIYNITKYYVDKFCDCETSKYKYIHQNITLIVISILIVFMILLFKYV